MRKNTRKIITTTLVLGMSLSLVGCSNAKEESIVKDNENLEVVETVKKPLTIKEASPIKKETVYALLNSNGEVGSIIVSDELKNIKEGTFDDKSDLQNIVNVKGEETFEKEGENLKWNVSGDDIYYQGTTDKQLPIGVKVTYTLDGKNIKADELKGKSGHVQIRYDFANNTSETIKGKEYKIPFVCVAGSILDNQHFYNVEIINGEAVDDGNHTAVMGYAIPGVIDSIGLKPEYKNEIGDKSYFEISADVIDFKMGNTFIAISNSLINDTESLDLSKIDELGNDIDKLANGMKDLKDGSNKLLDGTNELKNGLYQLSSNSKALNDGATTLFDTVVATAVKQINEGLAAEVGQPTADALTVGINKNNYEEKINGIIKTVATNGVASAITDDQIKTIATLMIASELQKGTSCNLSVSNITSNTMVQIAYIQENGQPELTAEQQLMLVLIQNDYSELINASVQAVINDLAVIPLTNKQVIPVACLMIANILQTSGPSSLNLNNLVAATKQTLLNSSGTDLTDQQKLIITAVNGNYNSIIDAVPTIVKQKLVEQAISSSDFNSMRDAINSLDKVGVFCSSLHKYTDGVDAAYAGSIKLSDGAKELKDGLKKFDEEGISKLVNIVKNDLKIVIDNLDNLKAANDAYDIFTNKIDGIDSSVNFVYRIDSIE